jgi:hypothetical protein
VFLRAKKKAASEAAFDASLSDRTQIKARTQTAA